MNSLKRLIYGSPVIIVISYLLFGIAWILFSDQFVLLISDHPESVTAFQSYKGLGFIGITGGLLYLLIQVNNNMLGEVIGQLDRSKKEFLSTFEQAPVGIAHHRPNEKWLRINHTLCELLGYQRSELLESDFEDFIHEDDIEPGRKMDAELLNGSRQMYSMEKRYRRKDGSCFTGQLTKSIAQNGDKESTFLVAIIQDISEQKKAEEEVRKSLRHKEQLLAEVHHRVRNNLALISALFELEHNQTKDQRTQKILENSKMRLKCMAMIYDHFSMSERDVAIEYSSYLNELIDYIERVFDTVNNGISVKRVISGIKLNINLAIPVALVCNELLLNALLHAFDGIDHPEIEITLHQKEDTVTLQISDNGTGLPAHVDVKNPQSMGFTILDVMASQIGAELILSREAGTRIRLSFTNSDVKGPGDSRNLQDIDA